MRVMLNRGARRARSCNGAVTLMTVINFARAEMRSQLCQLSRWVKKVLADWQVKSGSGRFSVVDGSLSGLEAGFKLAGWVVVVDDGDEKAEEKG